MCRASLITPGIMTDTAGFVLVIPWIRKLIRERLKEYFKGRIDRIQIQDPQRCKGELNCS
jgi:UPF0716 family protein affecting phage T7 exclusion